MLDGKKETGSSLRKIPDFLKSGSDSSGKLQKETDGWSKIGTNNLNVIKYEILLFEE